MKVEMMKDKLLKLFESRRGNLDYRVNRDIVRNGIATIPCRISEYSDVINAYSVKGCEALNPDFMDYIKESAEMAPPECPLIVNIVEDCLSKEERRTAEAVIRDSLAYNLGLVEREEKRHTKTFWMMVVGLIAACCLLYFTRELEEESREIFFVLFAFMGDNLCDYIFLTGYDLRRDRRLAGRLASCKVVFSKKFEARDYTEKDVEQLYAEIEKDVQETIQGKR